MSDVISYWLNIVYAFVDALFTYEMITGVSFGWFVVACLVLGVVIRFLFTRLIK